MLECRQQGSDGFWVLLSLRKVSLGFGFERFLFVG